MATKAEGLKKLRAKSDKAPTHECGNCGCKRYSPCYCMKKGGVPNMPTPKPEVEAKTD